MVAQSGGEAGRLLVPPEQTQIDQLLQQEDLVYLETKVQSLDCQEGEEELWSKEVQAYKLGGHTGDKQVRMLGPMKDSYKWWPRKINST
jgi:hypothetical protein